MSQRLSPTAIAYLVLPPMLWAGNAVVGRSISPLVSAMGFNLMRWLLAFCILLPMAHQVLRRDSPLWPQWRRFAALGLLGTSGYNALNYLALHTSSAINVTLVGASTPVWMLLMGRLFFGQTIALRQALLASFGWAYYSWMLAHPTAESAKLRAHWPYFRLGQVVFGIGWSALFSAGEWALTPAHVEWGWPLVAALVYVGIGPAVLAYAAFGAGLQRAGPHVATHFINLTPLFTALLSALFLGEAPHLYHALAFVLIVLGIALARKP